MEPGQKLGTMLEAHSRNPAGTREHVQKPSSKCATLKEGKEGAKSRDMEKGGGKVGCSGC